MNKDASFESDRRTLWCQVYVAYVGAANAVQSDGAKGWADKAVAAFDERFKPKEPPIVKEVE